VNDIQKFVVSPSMTVFEAMSVIDKAGKGIAMVCNEGRLTGILTDGDIRRYILRGGELTSAVTAVANTNFKSIPVDMAGLALEEIKRLKVKALPVTDNEGKLVSICFGEYSAQVISSSLNIPVVIMAGGKGTRLYPYTKVLPKPLIPIGDIPITMHIIQHFADYGCNQFFMVVNHQKNLIKAYFSDVDNPYNVEYADEDEPLGTGGGIKLLESRIHDSFFMTNCDILIEADYEKIINYHRSKNNLATIVCATKKVTIPYGTITVKESGHIREMKEKPSFSFLANTGLYVLEPGIFKYIPERTFIHITDIIQKCINNGENVGVYPISENQWSDMGQFDEMEKMIKKQQEGK
jgi:dTDP-glucose pyrophosphorylase